VIPTARNRGSRSLANAGSPTHPNAIVIPNCQAARERSMRSPSQRAVFANGRPCFTNSSDSYERKVCRPFFQLAMA
jgi:hypothetical protein